MFRMMCKDLRLSPLRTFLTGLSMFIGIVALIAGVLVGALGKEFLLGVNAQLLGHNPTYDISISGGNFDDPNSMKKFVEKLEQTGGKTVIVKPKTQLKFTPIDGVEQLKEIKNRDSAKQRKENKRLYKSSDRGDHDHKNPNYLRAVYTDSGYNKVHNIPLFKGRWFDKSNKQPSFEVVLNKSGYDMYNSEYFVSSREDTLDFTLFKVVGVVNDGYSIPLIYVSIAPLIAHMPTLFSMRMLSVYWHDSNGLSMDKMKSYMNDVLHDTTGGEIVGMERVARADSYGMVVDVLQISLFVSAMLLLLSTVFGQINIGLASLEQRMRELLIRRALGASKGSIVMLVLSSLLLLSMIVCVVSVLFSIGLVHFVGLLLSHDSPIGSPAYPITAALVAVAASVFTALLGGLIPAIKAFRLEPALALR